jgi:hypothetical protein
VLAIIQSKDQLDPYMADLGKLNTLKYIRYSDHGVYLDGCCFGEILLPEQFVPESMEPGNRITADAKKRSPLSTNKVLSRRDNLEYCDLEEFR